MNWPISSVQREGEIVIFGTPQLLCDTYTALNVIVCHGLQIPQKPVYYHTNLSLLQPTAFY